MNDSNPYECWHCGDGEFLRDVVPQSCAYCGRDALEDDVMEMQLADSKNRPNQQHPEEDGA